MELNILDIYKKLKSNRRNKIFVILFVCLLLFIFLTPMFFPKGYSVRCDTSNAYKGPSFSHLFGTDATGRDLFIRVLEACKLSLFIAFLTTVVSVCIGTIFGVASGFYGGRVDAIMMRIVDGLYAVPFIFLTILLVAIFGRNFYLIFISIGCVSWLDIARVIRGQTLEIKNKEYILAARIMGLSNIKIIFKHILHNLTGTILVFATLTIPNVLYVSAFLGFLGFGVQPPLAGLGELINEGRESIASGYWWLLFFPCFFMVTLVLYLNLLSKIIKDLLEKD